MCRHPPVTLFHSAGPPQEWYPADCANITPTSAAQLELSQLVSNSACCSDGCSRCQYGIRLSRGALCDHHRRNATMHHTASTSPNGHARWRNPYTEAMPHATAKARTNHTLRFSNA